MRPVKVPSLIGKGISGRAWTACLVFILVGVVVFATFRGLASQRVSAAPEVYSSPIQGSCYQVTPDSCKLQVDPFTINIAPGENLLAFRLQANGQTIYDFRSDISNPPSGAYMPSQVVRDFAAQCGETYVVNLLAMDSGDAGFLNAGQAEAILCPEGISFSYFLPAVIKNGPGQ